MMVKPPTRCKLQTRGVRSRSEKERERNSMLCRKRHPHPSLYRPRRGSTPPLPPCGTKPPRGGVVRLGGGMVPSLGAKPKGEAPPSPHGPFKAQIPFHLLINYLNHF